MEFEFYDFAKRKNINSFKAETEQVVDLQNLKCRDSAICKLILSTERALQGTLNEFTSKSFRYEVDITLGKIKRPKGE